MTGVKKSPVENYVNKNYVLLSSEMSQHLTIEHKGQKHKKIRIQSTNAIKTLKLVTI